MSASFYLFFFLVVIIDAERKILSFILLKRIYIDKSTIENTNIKRFFFLIMFPLEVIDNLYTKRKRKETNHETLLSIYFCPSSSMQR